MKRITTLLLLIIIAGMSPVHAQTTDTLAPAIDSVKAPRYPQFKLGVYYNTGLHYYGRVDSLKSSGFFPLAECWFTKNFYINAAPVFVNNAVLTAEYAGTVATAGYLFNDGKRWAGHLYFVKPFYRDNSELVQAALKAQAAASVTVQNKILNVTLGGDLKFSDRTDIGAMAGVDHLFRRQFKKGHVLVVDPSVYFHGGTQQFTRSFYEKRTLLILPLGEEEINKRVEKFYFLSCEASMPIVFATGKWQFLATPAYVIPKNILNLETGDVKENGDAFFYATAGVRYNF